LSVCLPAFPVQTILPVFTSLIAGTYREVFATLNQAYFSNTGDWLSLAAFLSLLSVETTPYIRQASTS